VEYTHTVKVPGCWDNQGLLGSAEVPDVTLREALERYVETFAPGGGFVYMPMVGGRPDDPRVQHKMGIIRDYYYSTVRDYYRTH
jgi:hypothetical protein